ncbi:MAG: glycosyltransferase family 4 protein [Firmicutes bacterium]|nr:glycosyltransferase family 4 protein [Bacillota bacterium]
MRAAILLAGFYASGQTRHVVDLARGLRHAGHEVVLVNTQPSGCAQPHRDRFLRTLDEAGVELRYGDPLESDLGPVDLVHAHSTLDWARADRLACRLARPFVLTAHGLGVTRGRLRPHLTRAAAVIAVGRRVADELEGHCRRLFVIENGVDTDEFSPVPEVAEGGTVRLPVRPGGPPFVIVYAGRLSASRRAAFRALAEAVAELSERRAVRFAVLSDGLPRLPRAVLERLGQDLDFRGWVWDTAVVMREADVVVGCGRVIREGLVSGRPCLILGPGYGGLVDPSLLRPDRGHDFSGSGPSSPLPSVARLARDLGHLAADPDLRRRLGSEGRRYAVMHLSLGVVVAATLGAYAAALRTSPSAPTPSRRPPRARPRPASPGPGTRPGEGA